MPPNLTYKYVSTINMNMATVHTSVMAETLLSDPIQPLSYQICSLLHKFLRLPLGHPSQKQISEKSVYSIPLYSV